MGRSRGFCLISLPFFPFASPFFWRLKWRKFMADSSLRSKRLLAAIALAGLGALFGGCSGVSTVRVQPWQRGALADATMNPARDPLATMNAEHIYTSRENAMGGRGVGGAGCGCN